MSEEKEIIMNEEIVRRIFDPNVEPELFKRKVTLCTGETITFKEAVRRLAIIECEKEMQKRRIQEKKTVKELSELDLSSENFYEEEQEALENLPYGRRGMELLLDYLEGMDSFAGYQYLFDNYGMFMSLEIKKKMQRKAEEIFGTDTVFLYDE